LQASNRLFMRIIGLFKNKFACHRKHYILKLSLYRPWRPLGLWEVEAPTFTDIRHIDGGKVVSPMSRPLLPPGRFLVLISVRGWVDSRTIFRLLLKISVGGNIWWKHYIYITKTIQLILFMDTMAVFSINMKSATFWNITLCSPSKIDRRFRVTYHLHLQSRWIS
jgi:hypothetical protein